jgi:nitrate reductase gamma subunit
VIERLHFLCFGIYPYICLTVFLLGSLVRFDRDQYTWKSDSSQLLRAGQLRWGSYLFHGSILLLFFTHLVGLVTPHWLYAPIISASAKQVLAIVVGGILGVLCFIGLSMLLYRRLADPRIRMSSRRTDIFILALLWVQVLLGLITLPFSYMELGDARNMLVLSSWVQSLFVFNPDTASLISVSHSFKVHILLGMTIFLVFPFTRLVHIWSGFGALAYPFRPYQLVRSKRLNLPQ